MYAYISICIYVFTCMSISIYIFTYISNCPGPSKSSISNSHVGAVTIWRLFRSVTIAKKLHSRCLRLRQRQPKQLHAGSPNAHQGGRSDCACVARPGAGPARPMFGAPHACAGLAPGRAKHARSGRPP